MRTCTVSKMRLRSLTDVLQQKSVAAQGPASVVELLEELDVVQVAWDVVGALVEDEVLATVLAHVHGVGSADGPHLLLVAPCDVGDSVSTSLDVGLLEVEVVLGEVHARAAQEQLSTVQRHPQTLLDVSLHEAHVLDAARCSTVVRDPEILTWLPGEEEVTTAGDGEVGTQIVTNLVDDAAGEVGCSAHAAAADSVQCGIDGLLHLCLPVSAGVLCHVNGSGRRGHLGLTWSEREDGGWLTWELWREWDAFPRLAGVLGVEHQGWLTQHPTLSVGEGRDCETVCDFLFGIEVGKRTCLPCVTTVAGLCEGSARSDKVPVRWAVEVDVVQSVLEWQWHLLPHFG
mmetsp:Transcript_11411/g.31585  ORF Transcript_11411/g.31585 Transcript_11411/m.31585 type:complete len:343 (+) Transcript_11411:363-1391(+)